MCESRRRRFASSCDLIRGKRVEEALSVLEFTPRKGAKIVAKMLRSAIANAENNQNVDVDSLFVKRIVGGSGPDAQAVPTARAGSCDAAPQAHQPHHDRPRRNVRGVGMGQKTHPKGFRLGVIENWDSRWFAKRDYASLLHEDIRLRNFIKKRLYHAGISKIEIERAANKAKINIYTARPGIVIGKKGAEIEKLKQELTRMTGKETYINIHEVRRPDLDAQLVAENVALQLERRVAFRRAMKEACGAGDAHGRAGHPHSVGRAARRLGDRAPRVVSRRARAAPHAARRRELRHRPRRKRRTA